MNVEKNIRGRQRVLVTVWIWHIVLILYILFIYSNSMRPAVQSSAESGRILRFLQKLAAESGVAVPWLTEHIVRKCAHFIEYTGLGMLLRQSDACVRRNRTVSEKMRIEDLVDRGDGTGRMCALTPDGHIWLEPCSQRLKSESGSPGSSLSRNPPFVYSCRISAMFNFAIRLSGSFSLLFLMMISHRYFY